MKLIKRLQSLLQEESPAGWSFQKPMGEITVFRNPSELMKAISQSPSIDKIQTNFPIQSVKLVTLPDSLVDEKNTVMKKGVRITLKIGMSFLVQPIGIGQTGKAPYVSNIVVYAQDLSRNTMTKEYSYLDPQVYNKDWMPDSVMYAVVDKFQTDKPNSIFKIPGDNA